MLLYNFKKFTNTTKILEIYYYYIEIKKQTTIQCILGFGSEENLYIFIPPSLKNKSALVLE